MPPRHHKVIMYITTDHSNSWFSHNLVFFVFVFQKNISGALSKPQKVAVIKQRRKKVFGTIQSERKYMQKKIVLEVK